MAGVGKVGTTLKENLLYKPVNWLGNLKPMKRMNKEYQNNNHTVMDGVGVGSIVLRDAVGCYLYVTQSLHNEGIPEDKRKFVAAYDLVNGMLMMSLQVAMFFGFKKVQNKVFAKTMGKYFNRNAAKGYKSVLAKTEKFKGIGGDDFHPGMNKYKTDIIDAFTSVTSLVASTIVAKRMLVPFISTSISDSVKDMLGANKVSKQEIHSETKNNFDKEKKLDINSEKVEQKPEQKTEPQITGSNRLVDSYVKTHS